MGYHPRTRCNEYRLVRTGRRRSYTCRQCGKKFRTDFRLTPMPEKERVCHECFWAGKTPMVDQKYVESVSC